MSFINISKVTLENAGDIRDVMGDVVLVTASITHDYILQKKYTEALESLRLLNCSIKQLEYALNYHNTKESV